MLGVASLNFNIWNRLESHGIACSKHALHSPEEKCEQFHRASSSAGARLVNMASNVVLRLSRNQPISPALHSNRIAKESGPKSPSFFVPFASFCPNAGVQGKPQVQ